MEELHHGIMDYLKVFFRRKWYLIIPAFVGLLLGVCLSMILPKEYLSSMKFLIEEEKNDNPLLNNIAMETSAAQRMQTIKDTMLGWDSLSELIKRLHMDRNIHSQIGMEQYVKKLQSQIAFLPSDQNMIQIAYVSTSPQMARDVVKNLTDIFIERNVQVQERQTSNAIRFIQDQLHVYLGKIKSAEIADLKDKLSALLVDSTEMHPDVIELRMQINQKMEQLKREGLDYTPDEKLSADTTNPMVTQIQAALANIGQKALTAAPEVTSPDATTSVDEKNLYKVMLMDKIDTVMARDVNVNETIYNSLLQRLETAKITQRLEASKEGTRYTIVEDARVPTQPFRPNKVLIAFVGLLAGLGLGGALVFMMEFLDKSFLDAHEASAFLNVPLLGAISKINTEESLRDYHNAQARLVFWMLSGGALMICLTLMVSNILNLQR